MSNEIDFLNLPIVDELSVAERFELSLKCIEKISTETGVDFTTHNEGVSEESKNLVISCRDFLKNVIQDKFLLQYPLLEYSDEISLINEVLYNIDDCLKK